MDRAWYNLTIVLNIILISIISVYGETYSVKIGEEHVNIVDKNFLSFTVDPMHLFSSVEAYNNKECTCMASFLTPAYLRIAGPSTSHMTFENTSITIDKSDDYGTKEKSKPNFFKNLKKRKRQTPQSIKISNRQWREFIQWAKKTGFDLVFALNNEERTSSDLWDPSSTLTVLSLAEKANIEDIVWQLGYECNNKTIDEYLNDLETLRVLTESIQGEKPLRWKTAGSDITGCLKDASDFRDYVALALDMSDVLLLNGNSSSQELERMSASDRIKLLTQIHHSATPLWISEHPQWNTDLVRAADWMAGLGYSARNGFSVHFRELIAEELYEPSLSFYMALLYKNFVGDRVLPVDFDSSQAILFAHCTSLRHKPVPKAVTLYGVNMEDEPARLSIKLTKKEEGGEIMQFIMKQEENGDILVNRRVMSSEGDFRPVVKHVRPYKNLLLHLPAKSFGFWVLANTNIKACQKADNDNKDIAKTELNKTEDRSIENEKVRRKRFAANDNLESDLYDTKVVNNIDNSIDTVALKEMIINLNNELKDAQNFFELNTIKAHRQKRQVPNGQNSIRKLRRQQMKPKKDFKKYDDFERKPLISFIRSLVYLTRKNTTKSTRKPSRIHKKRFGNKYYYDMLQTADRNEETNKVSRYRRSVIGEKNEGRYINKDLIIDNEIDIENKDKKLWHVLNRIQNQLDKMTADLSQNDNNSEPKDKSQESENVILKTEISDDSATINFSESTGTGLVKTTFDNLFSVLGEVNSKLNKLWTVLSILE